MFIKTISYLYKILKSVSMHCVVSMHYSRINCDQCSICWRRGSSRGGGGWVKPTHWLRTTPYWWV